MRRSTDKVLPQMKTHITYHDKNITSILPFPSKHTFHTDIPYISQICHTWKRYSTFVTSLKLAVFFTSLWLAVFKSTAFISISPICFALATSVSFPSSRALLASCLPLLSSAQGTRFWSPGSLLFVPKVHGPWHSAVPLTTFLNPSALSLPVSTKLLLL